MPEELTEEQKRHSDELEIMRREVIDIFGKINPNKIAIAILRRNKFKTMRDNGEIYFYNGKIWQEKGEKAIQETCQELLHDDATTHRINETIAAIQNKTYCKRENTKGYIALENGLFCITSGTLEPFTPELFITRKLNIDFGLQADCPKIKQFIKEIVNEADIEVVQEIFGYCLYDSYPIQKAVLLIGGGSNGKSTLLDLFREFLGLDNIAATSLQDLDNNPFSKGRMWNKMANIFADLPDKALYATGTFKMLTGGDIIEADKKFKDSFKFKNTAKLIFSCNKLPESKDNTDAFFRRWVFINFPHTFPDTSPATKKNLIASLTTKEEMSGLFIWAYEGLIRLLRNQNFTNSQETNKLRDYYERMSSPIAAFVKDCIESGEPYTIDAKGWVKKDDLFSSFVEYCQANKLPACASNTFGRDLPQYCPSVRAARHNVDGRQAYCWDGIQYIITKSILEPEQATL